MVPSTTRKTSHHVIPTCHTNKNQLTLIPPAGSLQDTNPNWQCTIVIFKQGANHSLKMFPIDLTINLGSPPQNGWLISWPFQATCHQGALPRWGSSCARTNPSSTYGWRSRWAWRRKTQVSNNMGVMPNKWEYVYNVSVHHVLQCGWKCPPNRVEKRRGCKRLK